MMLLVAYMYWMDAQAEPEFLIFMIACSAGIGWLNFNAMMGVMNFVQWVKQYRAARMGRQN